MSSFSPVGADAYPGQPGTTLRPECQAPRRLEGLEVLIWLEEGEICAEGVDEAEDNEAYEDVSRSEWQPMLRVKLTRSMRGHSRLER